MDNEKRRAFLSVGEVMASGNPPVLGVRVSVPRIIITGEWDETGEGMTALKELVTVWIELDAEEMAHLRMQGQDAVNQFAKSIAYIGAERLGGYVKKWE